ncbi:GEM-like protein 5 [Argentina anserina]|uniref:GEM-like protein 5 n=1 Tax=Argentina anserina TaxID=57926 RepID=UPI0021764A63|nr:GEM-like protein 5 [Potentilla anserina]
MNNSNQEPQPPMYPSIPPPLTQQEANPFHQSHPTPAPEDINPFYQTPSPPEAPKPQTPAITADHLEKWQPAPPHDHHHQKDIPSSSSSEQVPAAAPPTFDGQDLKAKAAAEDEPEKWGTHVMGHPAVPTCHPDNKKAALWGVAADGTEKAQSFHYPYLQYQPVDHNNKASSSSNPTQSMLNVFNSWSHKAESMANNIWHNLKTGTSVSGAAWAKMNLQAKALTGGGFEALYKQTFATYPNEKLHKSFACYLSTSTGPVAGTLYLSNIHTAFCSDRPLSFTAPSGQVTWSYYKVMVPLANVATINPVMMRENATERYLQIVTIDGHDFWFMGFVNYEKASKHLTESISTFVASGFAVQPPQYEKPAATSEHNQDHKKGGDHDHDQKKGGD